ncbi:hypothetical protein PMZ80_006849 [Knufia obscura]|uniref:L-ornithine N(5)-monooxygenase n=1 Tax=Knufia obscura TaxID=1635080 RepID=A0ABR0RJX4_9EURO|nr:hypothetical protein PMZ80_006849 [Knufia obscura]
MTSLTTTDLLSQTRTDAVHDLLSIGFGPASLAIAVAIYDILEQRALTGSTSFTPKVRFLERQSAFGWHAGMLLPGTKMQISFIKDLATMRNPKSRFTFLNYLKEHNRLAQFANLDTFLPFRVEFEDYLKWSACHFSDLVEYSQDVTSVKPLKLDGSQKFNCLEVTSKDVSTGATSVQHARNIVIAIGGRPSIPSVFPRGHERIIHSSRYNLHISSVLPNKDKAYSIAVIGAGQSAAEVFNDLQSRYPNSKNLLLMRDTALRPSDDSPFVNEVFNPEVVDEFYSTAPDVRSAQLKGNKATNYSVVRLGLLEQIYEDQYQQRMQNPDPDTWHHRILPSREVVEVTDLPQNKRLNLTVKNFSSQACKAKETYSVDAVILATGYVRDVHNEMLKECQAINGSRDGAWISERDYKVKLDRDFVEDDVQIYLQGCNEQTHGLSDTLLSILATRGGEIVDSVFGGAILEADTRDLVNASSSDMSGPLGPLWKLSPNAKEDASSKRKRAASSAAESAKA